MTRRGRPIVETSCTKGLSNIHNRSPEAEKAWLDRTVFSIIIWNYIAPQNQHHDGNSLLWLFSKRQLFWEWCELAESPFASQDVRPWGSLSWPNRISILRLLLVAPFVMMLMNQGEWAYARHAALGIFIVTGLSDLLDGMLARRLNLKTRLGAILDPLADKALIICAVVLLALPDSAVEGFLLPNLVMVIIVGKDLWVIIGFIVVYLVTDRFRVYPTLVGKATTFGQLVMVGLVLIAPDLNRLSPKLGSHLAYGASWIVAGLSITAVLSYTRLGLLFVAEGQKPLEAHGSEVMQDDESD
ncbi:MAG: CDP-alcohol phosphatidyltransferase family protein [Planctomycetota bacterium]|jgi:cardiolipin synthase